jgi:hypothetical protein
MTKKNVSEKSKENLKLFEIGNPGGGRPKGSVSLVSILQKVLTQKVDITDPFTKERGKKELQEAVVISLLTKAIKGDVSAIKEVLERIDGKVLQKTETTLKTHEQALMELE